MRLPNSHILGSNNPPAARGLHGVRRSKRLNGDANAAPPSFGATSATSLTSASVAPTVHPLFPDPGCTFGSFPHPDPRANALGMGIVETGRFAQILGRKASKKIPVKRDDLPAFEIPE